MRLVLSLLALGLSAALTGCSSGREAAAAEPRAVTLALAGAPGMNAGGNAAVLIVYQLTDAGPFTLVPLEEFWTSTDEVFGGTLVATREVVLYPQEVRAVPLVLDDRTTHVGIAADFRAPSLDGWRVVLPVARVLADGLGVMVGDDALALTGPPAAPADAPDAPARP